MTTIGDAICGFLGIPSEYAPFTVIGVVLIPMAIFLLWIRVQDIIDSRRFSYWRKVGEEAAKNGDDDGVHYAITGMMGYHK